MNMKLKNIFKRENKRSAYLVKCNDKIAESVYSEIGRYFSTKYINYQPGLSDESYVEFISTKTKKEIVETLEKVFGNVCNISDEYGTIVMEMKTA